MVFLAAPKVRTGFVRRSVSVVHGIVELPGSGVVKCLEAMFNIVTIIELP